MRERKRLEEVLSLEGDLARRTDDIGAYFDLAGEGENVAADLQRELESLRELVDRVEDLGGAVAAIEAGFVQGEIEEAAYRYTAQVESGERVVVGVNEFTGNGGEEPIGLHHLDPGIERRQLERTARVRAERSTDSAAAALAEVRRVATDEGNLLPPMREALRARCTVGEICEVLRDEWGTYDAQRA